MPFNVQQLVSALEEKDYRLFHFTDGRNLPSIRARGLWSTRLLREHDIEIVTGGDEDSLGIDEYRGYDRFVRLSFCKNHPMEYRARQEDRIANVKKLRISPSVMLRDGVLLADRVATANEARVMPIEQLINDIDIAATFGRIDWKIPENLERRKAAEKWEVLVPNIIELEHISGL